MARCERVATRLIRRRSAQARSPHMAILLRLFHANAFQQCLEVRLARLPGDLSALCAVAELALTPKVAVAHFDKTLTASVVTRIGLAGGRTR